MRATSSVRSILISVILPFMFLAPEAMSMDARKKKEVAKETTPVKVEMTNVLIDGKKVWQPAELKLESGKKYEIVLKNTLEDPHGFEIPGLTKPLVVKGMETVSVEINAEKKGTFAFKCQLHPAHVGGNITVQ